MHKHTHTHTHTWVVQGREEFIYSEDPDGLTGVSLQVVQLQVGSINQNNQNPDDWFKLVFF